jgi:hypothetical protein
MDIFLQTISHGLLRGLLVASVFAVVAGAWLLLAPESFAALSKSASRWVSTRAAVRWLENPRYIERFFYRHHRIFGVMLMVGAAYAVYHLTFQYNQARSLAALAVPGYGPAVESIAGALVAFLLFGNLTVFFIGATVLGRPSLLKGMEAVGNRWISTRKAFRLFDTRVEGPDRLAERHPRVLGTLVLLGGLYAALQLGVALI